MKNNMTNQEDGNGKQHVTHPSRARRLGIARPGLLALMTVFALGFNDCDDPIPHIDCGYTDHPIALQLDPGTCVAFVNPCATHEWLRPLGTDGFRFRPTAAERAVFNAEQVRVDSGTSPGGETVRSICVGADAPPHDQFPISYIYWYGRELGIGSLFLTVNQPTPTPTPTPTPLTASFIFNVLCCPTLNLDASASTGNIVSYTWDLSWTAVNPDRVTSSPTTTFAIREFDRGTITLTVTDAAGNTGTTTRNF